MADAQMDLTDPNSFNYWTEVTIRYSDQDSLGHVNNVAYGAYVEAGRTFLIEHFTDRQKYPNLDFVLARVTIDFIAESHWPGTFRIGSCITHVGRKSISSGYGVFIGDECKATSQCVNVYFDLESRRSVEPPEEIRQRLLADLAG